MSHYLYRLFDADDVLIYIGISRDVEKRVQMHLRSGRREIREDYARHECVAYPDAVESHKAERETIAAELPKYNIQHHPSPLRQMPRHMPAKSLGDGSPNAIAAANIRAESARARCSQTKLALALGMKQQQISRRLAGLTPFTIDEIFTIAEYLKVPPTILFPRDSSVRAA